MQFSDNCLAHAYFHKIQEEIHNIDHAIKSSSVIGFFCQCAIAQRTIVLLHTVGIDSEIDLIGFLSLSITCPPHVYRPEEDGSINIQSCDM